MKTSRLLSLLLVGLPFLAGAQNLEMTTNTVMIDVKDGQAVVPKTPEEEPMTLASLGITEVPRYWALIIGISDYKNTGPGLPNLDMPVQDAGKLYQILTDEYIFDAANVTLLNNATREDIINNFDRLANEVGSKDNVLIYYAGHGFYDKDKDFGFWLPSDAKIDSRAAWIANSTIKDYIGAINSRHTLLITDACFGGSIFKTRSVDAAIRQFTELYRPNSRRAMTSGNLTTVPDKSVFVHYLLKNLEENSDLFLPASKLFARMYEPILNNAPTVPQFGVIQATGDEGGDFIFIKR